MDRRACSAHEAFELRASSQTRNEKVRAIASELVRRTAEGRPTDTATV